MTSRITRFFLISFGLVLPAAFCSAAESNAPGRTWRTIDEVTPAERDIMDLRADTPRDAATPYLPAEPYPFEPPYTAEEVGYRLMNFSHMARWSHVYAEVFGVITKTGYLTQNIMVGMVKQTAGGHGLVPHLRAKPGDPYLTALFYYTYPPKNDGVQEIWFLHRTGMEQPTKLNYFVYSPSLRRVRRQPPPRRDQQFPDNVPSFDDIAGRESWEQAWRFIGVDVLRETVRFPTTRPTITLARPDGSFFDRSTADIRMMGDDYPYYRPDGGIDCYVVVAEPKRDWLPDYNISKFVYWVDQHYFYPLRIEQYDNEGKLKTIQVRLAQRENPNLPDGEGYTNYLTVYFDAKLDLISYNVHDAHTPHEWSTEEQEFFTPDFMRRDWLTYPKKSQSLVGAPDEFYLRPHLLADRFPNERSIEISADVAARIEAQDAVGHLVFGPAE